MAGNQATVVGGPIGHLVVTPDMVPPAPEPYEAKAAAYAAEAARIEEIYQRVRAANTLREQSAQSVGFNEGHEVNRRWAVDLLRLRDMNSGAAKMYGGMATVFRNIATHHQSIIHDAEQQAAAAKNAVQLQAIIAEHHAFARSVTASGVEAAVAHHTHFQREHGQDYTALVAGGHGFADDPVLPQPDPRRGIARPVRNGKPKSDDDGGDETPAAGSNPASAHGKPKPWATQTDPNSPSPVDQLPAGTPAETPFPGGLMPGMPASGGFRSAGVGGGMPSGGGLGGLPAGGGMGGFGVGNPLSGLPSGAGSPGAAGGGLAGMSSAVGGAPGAAGFANPSAAFSQGLAAGGGSGVAVPPLPPATTTGGPAAGAVGGTPASGVPAAGVSSAAAASPGIAGPGAHVESVGGGGAAGGTAAAAPMMLPPPGMGAPPAAPVAGGGSTAGALTSAAGSGGSAGSANPGTAAAGSSGGGAALVPASMVSSQGAGAAAARGRGESPELTAAKKLVRQLRRDCDAAGYPCIDWAVGVLRSEADGSTEVVFTSNEGFGYIPWGVFVPRSARLLTADPLADTAFRQHWFGWHDPASMFLAYAELRAQRSSRLMALAVTERSAALRGAKFEWAVCPRDTSDSTVNTTQPDDMHLHRLEVQFPDLYARIVRLATHSESVVVNQVVVPLAMQMVDAIKRGSAGVDCPRQLREMWDALGCGDEIAEDAWREFEQAADLYYVTSGASSGRPGFAGDGGLLDTSGRDLYRDQWLVARTMEVVRGWARRPVPVADMVYAAAAGYPGDFREKLEPMLDLLEREAEGVDRRPPSSG